MMRIVIEYMREIHKKMKLSPNDIMYVKGVYESFYGPIERIDDYFRVRKAERLKELPTMLFGYGDEYFEDYSISPKDMEFKVVKMKSREFDILLEYTSSFCNDQNPGKSLRYAVIEQNTGRYVGFIKLGSPVINMRPRNIMFGGPPNLELFNKSAIMGFVIVPVQPFGYNYLGGKLLALICTSHFIRREINDKYDVNMCMFETTSLYGNLKSASQYDGLKPFMRYKGLSDSKFLLNFGDKEYEDLRKFFVERNGGKSLVDDGASSRKLKTSNAMLGILKSNLRDYDLQMYEKFVKFIESKVGITTRKRYYISFYGYQNVTEYMTGKNSKLVKNVNFDRFELNSVIDWWKNKAQRRYDKLKGNGDLRIEQEIWDDDKIKDKYDIIR